MLTSFELDFRQAYDLKTFAKMFEKYSKDFDYASAIVQLQLRYELAMTQ